MLSPDFISYQSERGGRPRIRFKRYFYVRLKVAVILTHATFQFNWFSPSISKVIVKSDKRVWISAHCA